MTSTTNVRSRIPSIGTLAVSAVTATALSIGAQRIPDPIDSALSVECHSLVPVVGAWKTNGFASGLEIPMNRLGLFARKFAAPALRPKEDIAVLGDVLLVARGRPAQQAWVQRWLGELAKNPNRVAKIDVSYFEIDKTDFTDVCIPIILPHTATEDRKVSAGTATTTRSAVLDEAGQRRLNQVVEGRGGWKGSGHLASALVNEMQRASLGTLSRSSYIADFKPGPKGSWLPSTDSVEHGSTTNAAFTMLPDGGLGVRIVVTYGDLVGLPAAQWSPLHPQLQVQQPQLLRYELSDWRAIPSADHAAYYALPHPDSDRVLIVAVRAALAKP